jgi:bis(5'-nucleosyl)-tetraphosphatase (symmetrical)
MALYLIGDVQGCDGALGRLLDTVGFSPSRDRLVVLGDLVNRGPDSLAAVRRLMALGSSAQTLLGNHDLHLLAVSQGVRAPHRSDTLDAVLDAPDRTALLDWLRQRPLALMEHGWLLVHAGVLPTWSAADALELAHEVETVLQSPDWSTFLHAMYGNTPARWVPTLEGDDRLRVIVNAFTRLRFCRADGEMEFKTKSAASTPPAGFMPWYEVPGRRTAEVPVAFGHWSTLGRLMTPRLMALDTGCVWGGCLTAVRLDGEAVQTFEVACPQAQAPGGHA